jgi:hypothetical protein
MANIKKWSDCTKTKIRRAQHLLKEQRARPSLYRRKPSGQECPQPSSQRPNKNFPVSFNHHQDQTPEKDVLSKLMTVCASQKQGVWHLSGRLGLLGIS